MNSSAASSRSVRLGGSHGYRFAGDTAILNAELAIIPAIASSASGQQWALQLWALDAPYEGGALQGLKVAEVELAIPAQRETAELEVETFARLPLTYSEYNMVLVVAEGVHGHYDSVRDYSNYSQRQQFDGPRLEGNVGYRFTDGGVVLSADSVRNTRSDDNLSGSLSLELWATSQPYQGGELKGTLIGALGVGQLEGQSEHRGIEREVSAEPLPAGEHRLALVLTEWTDRAGHVARDYRSFSAAHLVLGAPMAHAATKEAPKAVAAAAKEAEAAKAAPATAKVEPAKAEPAKAEPAKAEPAKAESAKAEPAKAESAKAEPAKAEPAKTEPAKAEPAVAKQAEHAKPVIAAAVKDAEVAAAKAEASKSSAPAAKPSEAAKPAAPTAQPRN